MEAITYDRALAYKDEFPPDEYMTWQPKKVLSVLLEIDSNADQDSSLAIGIEEEYGNTSKHMNSLGSETVLNMRTIKKHYDALGSFLHTPSMKKMRSGEKLNYEKIRKRCVDIYEYLELVLSSPVFNITIGNFAIHECVECGFKIRKRLPMNSASVVANCFNCRASYTIEDIGENQVKWSPHQHVVGCANAECDQTIAMWKHEMEPGAYWVCEGCGGENHFSLCVRHNSEHKN